MTIDARASPGMIKKACPDCGAFWERIISDGNADLSEIKCRRCKRVITYRVEHGRVIGLATH